MDKTEKAMEKFFKNRMVAWIIVALVILASFSHGLNRDDTRHRAVVEQAFETYMWPIIEQGSSFAFNLGVVATRNGINNEIQEIVDTITNTNNISEQGEYFIALVSAVLELENAILAANFPDSELNLAHNWIVNFEEQQLLFSQSIYNTIAHNFNENIRFIGSDMPVFD